MPLWSQLTARRPTNITTPKPFPLLFIAASPALRVLQSHWADKWDMSYWEEVCKVTLLKDLFSKTCLKWVARSIRGDIFVSKVTSIRYETSKHGSIFLKWHRTCVNVAVHHGFRKDVSTVYCYSHLVITGKERCRACPFKMKALLYGIGKKKKTTTKKMHVPEPYPT